MKIGQNIQENNCRIAILDINESLPNLIKLSADLGNPKFKNKKQRDEFLSSRFLLKTLLPNATISYNKFGAPEVEDNNFISISHSKNLTAIIISKKKVGLDIEKINEKALKISSKFVAKNQHKSLSKEKATLIWCCKEAIYKWHQKGNINFVKDIKIQPFTIDDDGEIGAEFQSQNLTLYYKKIYDYFLVYVCN